MRLESISIANFRNHKLLEFVPGHSITNIYGRNGSGKTTILEAIHYCALTKGFSGNSDRDYLKFGEEMFTLRSRFSSDLGAKTQVLVALMPQKEKRIMVNEKELQTFSGHIGHIPCVTFTPREMVIINGAPSERRRFIDTAICQYDRKYLSDLMQYRRVLQQRNALLASCLDRNSSQEAAIEAWTEQLVRISADIVWTRRVFTESFGKMFGEVYRWMPEGAEPSLTYQCSLMKDEGLITKEEMKIIFSDRYRAMRSQELQRRQTIAGPHRDDMQFHLDGREIRKYASQGQQRAFLVAMKMTLHGYLHDKSGEMPITLLDDLFSELDEKVSGIMLETLSTKGQVIVTSTMKREGKEITPFSVEEYMEKKEKIDDQNENTEKY